MQKLPVSVVIITRNEEDNIADCLKSASWADEAIVLDDNSSDKTVDIAKENIFQQALSLIVENTGSAAVIDMPIELVARIEPRKPAEVVAGFLGRKLLIVQGGRPIPLVVLLDRIEPGTKRRYYIEGAIQAAPPFKVTYEIREEDQDAVLARYTVQR